MVIGRIIYLQVFSHQFLSSRAFDTWSRNLPIEADRGRILDRNGTILADSVTTTSLVFIPNQIEDAEEVAEKIAPLINMKPADLKEHATKRASIERVHPHGRRLSYDIADKINDFNLSGVYLVRESKRYYPNYSFLSHTLGYVGIDNQGLSGIELKYNDYLTGTYGSVEYLADAKGRSLGRTERFNQPSPGMDIELTINYDIQVAIERELDNVINRYNPDQASIIAMDPNTGEILGLSARPSFNPNSYQEYSTETINRNLPIWGTYEPGSTFKILTLAAALNEDKINLEEDTFYDSGRIRVANANIKCWKSGGHGEQTFMEVVQNSCNPGFVVLGQKLGRSTLFRYIRDFGFGSKTGIDLTGEGTGIIFRPNQVGPVELATTAFGQGVSVTPLQQITAVSAIINGGTLFQPYVVKRYLEPETGTVVKVNEPTIIRENLVSEETTKQVRLALENVVAKGTGRNAYIEGHRVGGKTGTGQKVQDGRYMTGNYILSFIGFAPANDPQVIVYVAVDNPKGVVQYGGTVAAPIAGRILEDSIDSLNIRRTPTNIIRTYLWNEPRHVLVPTVVGLSRNEANRVLRGSFNIRWEGSGDKVIEQAPMNRRLMEGSTIRLLLG